MNRLVVKSRVSRDGVLHLALPVGLEAADKEVQVTVEPVPSPPLSQEEWRASILGTAGSITDPEFRRWEQGAYEEREPLS